MKSDIDLFLSRFRNLALTVPYRSERYKAYLREKYHFADDLHHVFGSVHGMKSSDLFLIAVTRAEHNKIQHERPTIEQLLGAVSNLIEYVKYLEAKE